MKKHIKDAEELLDKYKRLPNRPDKLQMLHWLMTAVLFLVVRYIDGE